MVNAEQWVYCCIVSNQMKRARARSVLGPLSRTLWKHGLESSAYELRPTQHLRDFAVVFQKFFGERLVDRRDDDVTDLALNLRKKSEVLHALHSTVIVVCGCQVVN